jgi:hypothetical protein
MFRSTVSTFVGRLVGERERAKILSNRAIFAWGGTSKQIEKCGVLVFIIGTLRNMIDR